MMHSSTNLQYDCMHSPLRGHFFLEASAGTGKTYTIEHLVTRLLITESTDPSPPTIDEILVVTFTRAATRDLKTRIYETLSAAYIFLQKSRMDGPPYLSFFSDKQQTRALLRVERALHTIDKARIYTIHGFCATMLREYAFEGHLPLLCEETTEKIWKNLETDFFSILRSLVPYETFGPAQVAYALKKYGNNLRKLFHASLLCRGSIKTLPTFKESFAAFSSFLSENSATVDFLEDLLPLYLKPRVSREALAEQCTLLKRLSSPQDFDRLLYHRGSLFQAIRRANLKKTSFLDPGTQNAVDILAKEGLRHIQNATDPKKFLLRLAQMYPRSDSLAPDTLLQTMLQSLALPRFYTQVRKNFQAVIVDEFQDTDSLQWQILQKLFIDAPIPFLALVGDPKQSIYAFRNADLKIFLHAKKEVCDDRPFMLAKNFRSHPTLIATLNKLFDENHAPQWLTLDTRDHSILYHPVDANASYPQPLITDGKAPVHFFLDESEKGRSKQWPTEEWETTFLFPKVAEEILRLYTHHNIPLRNIGLLIKDRFQARRLLQYLRENNLSATTNTANNLNESPMFSLVHDALRVLQNPRDENLIHKLLSHKCWGFDKQELFIEKEPSLLRHVMQRLYKMVSIYKTSGISPTLQYLVETPLYPNYPPLIETLISASDLDDYNDVLQTTELLTEQEKLQGASVRELLEWMHRLSSQTVEDNHRLKRASTSEENSLHILTTHMSKGLEYDVVFAIGLCSHQPEERISLAQDQEKMRLLYVACTRAKRRLYIPYVHLQGTSTVPTSLSPLELFFTRLCAAPIPWEQTYQIPLSYTLKVLEERLHSLSISTEKCVATGPYLSVIPSASPAIQPPPSVHIPTEQVSVYSFSDLYAKEVPVRSSRFPLIENTTIPPGPRTGIFFHTLFERILSLGLHCPWQENAIHLLILHHIKRSNFASWTNEICSLIYKAFITPLQGSFALSDIPLSDIEQEMLFFIPSSEKSRVKGFVDLLFVCENRYYLLDWKLNLLEDYSPHALRQAMRDNHYDVQAAIYRQAADRWAALQPEPLTYGGAFYVFVRGLEHHQGIYHLSEENHA